MAKYYFNMRNILISFANGENVVIYDNTNSLTVEECRDFAETATGCEVADAYEVNSEELQYYCIDGRTHIDTKDEADKIRNFRKIWSK